MKRTLTLTALTALILAGGLPVLAASQNHGMRERPSFTQLDVNADGEVTADEIAAFRDARFAGIDTSGDGLVSRDEFLAHAASRSSERAARMFDRMDADGDGYLPRDLLASRAGPGPDRMLERLDADGSGGISAEEFQTMLERRAERGGGFMRQGGDHGHKRN